MLHKAKTLWNDVPDNLKRVLHTAWEVALPVLLTHLFLARSTKDVQASVIAFGAVFFAAVKNGFTSPTPSQPQ